MDQSAGLAGMISRIAAGAYRVEHDGRSEVVYVAGPDHDRWVFWNGHVFRGDFREGRSDNSGSASPALRAGADASRPATSSMAITAPMPARVSRIIARTGTSVQKGETLVVLEAMKMELPLRAPGDAVVTAVHCSEGDLVQADAVLMDLGRPA